MRSLNYAQSRVRMHSAATGAIYASSKQRRKAQRRKDARTFSAFRSRREEDERSRFPRLIGARSPD